MRFPKTVAVVRTYKVKRSGALQVLSMATDWSLPLVAKPIQPGFAWCPSTRSKPDGTSSPKGRHFRHRMQYDKSEVAANIRELISKTIRWLYFCKRQPAFGRAIEHVFI